MDFYRTQKFWPNVTGAPIDVSAIADVADKLDEKTYFMSAAYFVSAAKACGTIIDVISGKRRENIGTNDVSGICDAVPDIIPYNWILISKDVISGLLKSDSLEAEKFMTNALKSEFPPNVLQAVKSMLNPPPAATTTPTPSPTQTPVQQTNPSYCPNRTAEFIEELLKNNPCVRTVYVPDRWLVNRLNEFGSKVMYRPFVEDDRYAVDISKQVCK